MARHWTDKFSYLRGAVRFSDLGYFALSGDEMAANRTAHTFITEWNKGQWNNGGKTDWRTVGLAVAQQPLQQMIAIGETGHALLLGSGDRHEEVIASGDDAPKKRGPLRGVRTIGKCIYVVGMDRQAYRRSGLKKWSVIDDGARPPKKSKKVVGFEAVDGFSETDIYAVGWEGEIWRYDGKIWTVCKSPTEHVLTAVCCAGDDQVYACGRNGLFLRGRGDKWKVIKHKSCEDDFWSMAWYKNKLYLATMTSLYTLQNDDTLAAVDMGKDQAASCYDLSVGDGILVSTGAKDVMEFNGKKWSRID